MLNPANPFPDYVVFQSECQPDIAVKCITE